jgi:hypothetical protein
VARGVQVQLRGGRRFWMLFVVVAVVLVTVSVREADAIRRLGASAATAQARPAPGGTRASAAEVTGATTRLPASRSTTPKIGPASPGPPASKSGSAPIPATLVAHLNALVGGPAAAGYASVSALDLSSGRRLDYGATSGMIDASVSKLDVLEALLLAHQDSHTPLDGEDDELATAMIEHSDNDAGQALWNGLGSAAGIGAANSRLGLRHTVPGEGGYYGLTTSGASDQLVLLGHLQNGHGPLTAASRAYALGLLADVESDQRWGVSAAADPGTGFAVKNGWLSVADDSGRWAVNSDGIVTIAGHRVLIAVMTQHDVGEQAGITLVEAISRGVAAALV